VHLLAVVLDRYSRRVLGWSLSATKDVRLTLAAFNRAVFHRRPRPGVLFHSDRGIEYAAYAFRERLAALGVAQSMNRPREITDHATAAAALFRELDMSPWQGSAEAESLRPS
jgi:transposase InsO family protein